MSGTDTTHATALPRLDRFRPRGTPRRSRRARWRAAVLIGVHLLVLAHVAHWQVSGSTLTPVEPSEAMQTLELGYVNAGFLLFVALILLTAVFGRFFCGWACHVVAYQDLCAWLLGKVGLRPRPVRSRLLVWVPFGAAFYMFAWPTLARWLRGDPGPGVSWHLTTSDFWATFPGPWVSGLTFVVCGGLVVYWLGAKGFCTYGCPYGAVFGVAERVAPVRIRVTDACETCGHCTAVCTSNVRVHEEVARHGMVVDPGCMKCMDCVSVCPKDALYVGRGKPALGVQRKRPRADFSWGEEIALAVLFLLALFAFRSLYGAVPFLLALGMSVLAAWCGLVAWRLWRRADLTVQHRSWKAHGRLTARGRLAAGGLAIGLVFTVHSGVVQWHTWRGETVAHADTSAAGLAAAREHLESARDLGLFGDARVHQTLGLVLREQGEFVAAERELRAALAERPGWAAAVIPLTDLLMLRGERGEAERMLRAVLERDPGLVPARQRLERL